MNIEIQPYFAEGERYPALIGVRVEGDEYQMAYVSKVELADALAENAKLRELVGDMGELVDVLSECDMVCEHYHDGCIGDCYYVNARRELGIEVDDG